LLLCHSFVGEAAKVCFCNGPLEVNPFFAPYPLPGSCFCTGSALGCRLMVFEEEWAGPILDARGLPGFNPSPSWQSLRPDPIHRPGRDAASGRGYLSYPKPLTASPFAQQRAAESFTAGPGGVFPSWPEPRGAIVGQAWPLMPLPPLPHRRGRRQPACGAGSPQASWPAQPWPSASPRAWRASPPSSSRRRL
jgi:hypothetical protein